VEAIHKICSDRVQLKRLTKDEKIDLFKTVRYSYLSHENLISLTNNKTFELAKDFILEGLSLKLNAFESGIKQEPSINIHPRI
jgi:hypothetical protein